VKEKPRALTWLEEQTGQEIAYKPGNRIEHDRHLSVRLRGDLVERLQVIADARGVTLPQAVRDLLTEVVDGREQLAKLDGADLAARLSADVEEVRRRLAG
jgi:predicted transcriptional regulator